MASTSLTKAVQKNANTDAINKMTFSAWIKRSKLGEGQIFNAYQTSTYYTRIYFNGSDALTIYSYINGSQQVFIKTNRLFRDTNAWYHLVVSVDTTQATASDRVKIYINGVQETSFASGAEVYPSQNSAFGQFSDTGATLYIGSSPSATNFDGSMSHINYTPYTAYDASAFGSTDSTTGEWKINTSPSVTYSTAGFFILKNGNSVTDQSGNSNNFTVGGGTLTKTEDNPSNVFATLNPLDIGGGSYTFSNGNTKLFTNGGVQSTLSIGSSGKYYAEFKLATNNTSWLGIREQSYNINQGYGTGGKNVALYPAGATMYKNGTSLGSGGYGSSWSTGDIMQIAVDKDNNYIYFGKNGSWWNGSSYASATPSTYITFDDIDNYMFSYVHGGGTDSTTEANFGNGYFGTTAVSSAGTNASGNGIFEYDVPTGFTALSTKGLNL